MKRKIIFAILATLFIASCDYKNQPSSQPSEKAGKNNLPAHVKLIGTTPVKDQGQS